MLRTAVRLAALALLLPATIAFAQTPSSVGASFAQDVPPGKWLNQILPEKLPTLNYPAYMKDNPLERAKLEHRTGRDRLSLITLANVTDPKDAPDLLLLKAEDLLSLGRNEQVIELLKEDNDPEAQLLRISALRAMGRCDEAKALLGDHLKAHPDSIAGRLAIGQLHEQIGDDAAATDDYAWFVTGNGAPFDKWQTQQERGFDDADQVVMIGQAVNRWAAMTSAYEKSPQLNDAILNMFVKAYDVIDRHNAAAHVAAAEYQATHDNAEAATKELQLALGLNPHLRAALILRGKLALKQFNFDGCDQVCEELRQIDPQSADADILETRNLLAQRTPKDAMRPLQRVLAAQPKNIEALGLLASVKSLELRDDECTAVLGKVDAIAPHDATAYQEVADQLGAMRQYPRAATMYKVAIDRAPWWTDARNGLGLLYTQSGDEDDARTTLEAAHQLDPYNLRTTNYLRLLDQMDGFAKSTSPHFVVTYDPQLDPVIPEYFGDYLETAYKAVTTDFVTEPAQKTYIEVFPTHDAFSVRTTGSPWIGTVGASTGRVIALVSPRNGPMTMGTFNWTQVLRHEFTHTVTLYATDNRIPHWFTEGLAVWEEHSPLRWEWIPMLYQAVTKDELFTMDNLTWGFIRPRRAIDRQLAYAQSFWICTYIEGKYGHDAILKMLAGYKNGEPQDQVFPEVIHRTLAEFTDDFHAWTKEQIATWGYDQDSSKKYEKLQDEGESLIHEKRYPEAIGVWEQILKLRPVDEMPHRRLAGLYLTRQCKDVEKAVWNLKALDALELKDNRMAKRIAELDSDAGNMVEAIDEARRAVYIDPYDLKAHQLFAEVLTKSGADTSALAREHRVIPVLQKWLEDEKQRNEN